MASPIRIAIEASPQVKGLDQAVDSIGLKLGLGRSVNPIEEKLNRLGARGQAAFASMNKSAGGFGNALKTVSSGITATAATIYTLERAGRALRVALVDPFVDFTKKVLDSTEVYRRFRVSISGVAGSSARARAITQNLVGLSRNSPLTSAEMIDAARAAAFTPALSGPFALGSSQRAAKQFSDYAALLAKGAIFDPEQGERGVGIALREFLSGNAQSLRRRLEINPDSVADAIGKRLGEVLSNPQLGLKAFKAFTDINVGNEAFEGQQALFSNASKKLFDAINQGFAQIGESGTYNELTDRLRGLTDHLLDSFDPTKNPRFSEQARRISGSITKLWSNIFDTAGNLISRATGNKNPIDSVAEGITRVWEIAGRASDALPQLADWIGIVFGKVRQGVESISHGFSVPINVAGFNVASVGIGDGGRVNDLQRQIARTEARIHELENSADPYRAGKIRTNRENLGILQNSLKFELGSNGSAGTGILESLSGAFSADALGRPYAIQRQIQQSIDQLMAGVSARVAAQAVISPISRASGGYDYRSDYLRALEQRNGIPAQLRDLFGENGDLVQLEGYAGLLRAAERDAGAARAAPNLPARSRFSIPMPWSLSTGFQVTQTNRQALTAALGSDRAERYFADLTKDKSDALTAVENLPKRLLRELQSLSGSIASTFKDLPPQFAAELGESLQRDVAGLADQISGALHLPAESAALLRDSMKKAPAELQRFVSNQTFDARMRAIDLGLNGPTPETADRLLASPLLTPRQKSEALIAARAARQGELSARFDSLRSELAKTPNDQELKVGLEFAAQDLRENQQALAGLRYEINDVQKAFDQFGDSARQSLEGGLGEAIYDLQTGMGSLADVARQTFQSILREFDQMAAHNLVQGLVGNLGQANQGAGGIGSGGIGGFVGSLFGAHSSSASVGLTSHSYVSPGFGIPAMAMGGIVSKPTLSLIGEYGPEMVIPLPGSAGYAAHARQGGGGKTVHQTIHIHTPNADSFRRSQAQVTRQLREAVAD